MYLKDLEPKLRINGAMPPLICKSLCRGLNYNRNNSTFRCTDKIWEQKFKFDVFLTVHHSIAFFKFPT